MYFSRLNLRSHNKGHGIILWYHSQRTITSLWRHTASGTGQEIVYQKASKYSKEKYKSNELMATEVVLFIKGSHTENISLKEKKNTTHVKPLFHLQLQRSPAALRTAWFTAEDFRAACIRYGRGLFHFLICIYLINPRQLLQKAGERLWTEKKPQQVLQKHWMVF